MSRVYSIDGMKAIAGFLVVLIHQKFPGILGEIITPLARIAVPFFFITSGFLLYSHKQKQLSLKIKKQIKFILIITALSTILYLLWETIVNLNQGNSIQQFIKENFSLVKIAKLMVLNDIQIGSHLWYLYAYIYVLVIYFFINKYKWQKFFYKLIPILLIIDLIMGKYSILLFNINIPFIFVRNFMFVGLPYFMMGNLIAKINDENSFKINNNILIVSMVIFSVTTLLEKNILVINNINAVRDHYISTTLVTVTLFIYLLQNKNMFRNTSIERIGKEYSLGIYIIHPIVISLLNYMINFKNVYQYIAPFIVYFISLFIIIFFNKLKLLVKNRIVFGEKI